MKQPRYIPALSFHSLTPIYDLVLRWGMREEDLKRRLTQRAGLQAGQHVLDLGCGTGTLTVMMKRAAPGTQIMGLDGDPEVLSMARAKGAKAGVNVQWEQGMAYDLPYLDDSFDTVVSSLMIHHLVEADKMRAFREVHRVLKADGAFRILDFGRPFNALTRLQTRITGAFEHTQENFGGRIAPMLREAGFEAEEEEHASTFFGPIWFYRAVKTTPLGSSADVSPRQWR